LGIEAPLAKHGYLLVAEGGPMDNELLRGFALFEGMTDEELAASAALFEPIRRLGGERVTKENDFGYSLYLVIGGQLRVDVGGDEVDTIGPGDCFGEVSLVTGKKRNATVTALETCDLAKIMVWDFGELTAKNPMLAARIKAIADERPGNTKEGA